MFLHFQQDRIYCANNFSLLVCLLEGELEKRYICILCIAIWEMLDERRKTLVQNEVRKLTIVFFFIHLSLNRKCISPRLRLCLLSISWMQTQANQIRTIANSSLIAIVDSLVYFVFASFCVCVHENRKILLHYPLLLFYWCYHLNLCVWVRALFTMVVSTLCLLSVYYIHSRSVIYIYMK